MKKTLLLIASFLIFTCCLHAGKPSAPTDYFRSIFSGDWNDIAVWESSTDNINWFPATSWPTNLANAISIRNTHYVNVSNNQAMDQVVIENGGVLSHLGSTLTIMDGPGDDMIVLSGGTFTLASAGNPPVFAVATAIANINTGGILRVSAGGMTNVGTGVNASNYIYQDASELELTVVYSTDGVTYFPNVAANTIPVFRSATNLNVGSGGLTTFNGVFEAFNSFNIVGTGTKIFRNGIIGTGNINGSTSGKFIINGTTASLGGTGLLTLPTASGMDIGASTTVTMVSDKTVTGTIALLPSSALITLGNFNLTMTGDISGGSSTSHVVTNGSGKLIFNNVTGTPKGYPIGANATTINPMVISNGGGFSYGVRVEIGINPAIVVPLKAVNRTWFVTPTGGMPGTVNTNFFYYAGEGNAGFNYTANLELGHYTGAWNVIQTGLVPAGGYQVATTVSTFGDNIEAPLVLGNLGAILAAYNSVDVNYFTGIKQNNNHLLNWKLTCNNTASVNMVIERSIDGRNYHAVYVETATALRCAQLFSFTDMHPAAGVNYYRIKMTDANAKISYSSIVSLIHAARGIDVLNIAPNPIVNGSFNLQISAAEKMQLQIVISDMQGRVVQKQNSNMMAGFNSIAVHVKNIAAGTYQLIGNTVDGKTRLLRFVVQ